MKEAVFSGVAAVHSCLSVHFAVVGVLEMDRWALLYHHCSRVALMIAVAELRSAVFPTVDVVVVAVSRMVLSALSSADLLGVRMIAFVRWAAVATADVVVVAAAAAVVFVVP